MSTGQLTVGKILDYGCRVFADSTITTYDALESPRTVTFGDFGVRVRRLASGLFTKLGLESGDRVGTFMWNIQEHAEAYFAVPAMGAVLHTLNIRLFPEQIVYIVNHGGSKAIILDCTLADSFVPLVQQMPEVQYLVTVGHLDSIHRQTLQELGVEVIPYESVIDDGTEDLRWPETDENDAAVMCYTSGTTGDPKGVAYSHRSIYLHSLEVCMVNIMGLSNRDTILVVVPMFHANAWGLPYAALLSGSSFVLPGKHLQAEPLVDMIQASSVTKSGAVPTIWNDIEGYLERSGRTIGTLDEVVVGGSACPPALMKRLEINHGIRLLHAWGMTELSPLGAIARPPTHVEENSPAYWSYRSTQGRVVPLTEFRLVGPNGEELPWDGESVGEIQVRGPLVTGPYYSRVGQDEDKFVGDWLATGDVGSLTPNGYLTLTDRVKDVIKSGGEWISSVEVENLIMSHDSVFEAAVIGVPDSKWGERPVALVVMRDGAHVTVNDLRELLAKSLAKWQIPDLWAFVDEIPKTSVGKFDKKAMRQRHAEGALSLATG